MKECMKREDEMNPVSQEPDLLLPFEKQNIPANYLDYYKVKRHNFFATIKAFPELWRYYVLLDKIWLREIDDLRPSREPDRTFPLILYFNAHAKLRVAIELGFTGCLAEARSILRDAIESVAHGHRMLTDVNLQKIWLCKNDGQAALEEFKDAFERHKKDGLFNGLEELHRSWGHLSETGSHATVMAICDQFVNSSTDTEVVWGLKYCGLDIVKWEKSLFWLLLTCFTMEQTFFGDYESRLNLDYGLMRMRAELENHKEQVRKNLIARHNIPPPPSPLLAKV